MIYDLGAYCSSLELHFFLYQLFSPSLSPLLIHKHRELRIAFTGSFTGNVARIAWFK